MYRMLKKITSFIISSIMVTNLGMITVHARPDWPSDTGIMAGAGIVMDADSKTVLFGQQIHVPFPPASITKLLTALIVAENSSLDEMVTFSHSAVYDVEAGSGNKLALDEGDQISVEDCLHMLMLLSSNQSANALAEHVAGSREAFVEMMNERIAAIGCKESHFANPSGLNDSQQYVSAYDMALIAAEAFENETVMKISSTKKYRVSPTINNPEGANISMEHKILMAENSSSQFYCEGALAGKIGYTSIAGNTLVTYARRDGRNLICVILKGTQPQYYLDGKTILNFGFASFKNESVQNSETFLQEQQELEYQGGSCPTSRLRLEDSVITIPATAQFFDAERNLITELPQGHPEAAVAMLQYTYNDRKVGSAYVYDKELEARLAAGETVGGSEEETEGSSGGEEESPGSGSEETLPDETEAERTPGGRFQPDAGQMRTGAVVLAAAAIAGAVVFVVMRKRRKERLRREERRERRRQRLSEIGYNEEDFEELMRRRKKEAADRKG